ncbi:translation elongation factor Ts [Mycoplasma marinum]|uniref:Elongation factor Ts n=1 Tax=Mycoplasma marinum TaxID=1937190 RepID=A0A4R0XMV0_9MOLU|nr:translation elongation factor Ts [Mycoplasma marinum]TCG12041.1 elongation factor Ts [Mycoplasma marinum]
MAVTALQVKELRQRTGAGILDSKKALEATDGDIDKAIEWLQERGAAKAAKKANRISAEGLVSTAQNDQAAVMIEINSETDFVSKNAQFQKLVKEIAEGLLSIDFSSDAEAAKAVINGKTVEELCMEATTTIGEKISFRRATRIIKLENQFVGAYTHANGQIASLVTIEGGNAEAAKNVSMHVAAMNPEFLDASSMPQEKIEAFKAEIMDELKDVQKPENIKEKMAEGKLRKVLSDLTLVDQEFVMEKMPVSKYLKGQNATALAMTRFQVGEGIEKQESDFAAEVAAQMSA